MIFHSSTRHDIEKYYVGTYVKFKETGDRIWKIDHCNPTAVRAHDSTGFDIYIDLSEQYNVEYIIPGRRIFQQDDKALMIYRKPARQYFRGMHPENTGFAFLDGNGNWKEMPLDFSHIESFVNKPCYEPLEEAIKNEKQSCALTEQLAMAKNGTILFGFNKIGVVLPSSGNGLFTKVYKTELQHLFKKLSLTWTSVGKL